MKLSEKQEEFIESWSVFGTSWGINRTTAQIFSLLLITQEKLSVTEIMETLEISRGNISMNIKILLDWGLVEKKIEKGKRKEFYSSKGDMWAITRKVAEERKRREIDPLIESLKKLKNKEPTSSKNDETIKVINEILEVNETMDHLFKILLSLEKNEIAKKLLSPIIKKFG